MRLPSYRKDNMPWERDYVFSYSVKTELQSIIQVSQVTKKIKNRRVKKAKKKKKKLRLH